MWVVSFSSNNGSVSSSCNTLKVFPVTLLSYFYFFLVALSMCSHLPDCSLAYFISTCYHFCFLSLGIPVLFLLLGNFGYLFLLLLLVLIWLPSPPIIIFGSSVSFSISSLGIDCLSSSSLLGTGMSTTSFGHIAIISSFRNSVMSLIHPVPHRVLNFLWGSPFLNGLSVFDAIGNYKFKFV